MHNRSLFSLHAAIFKMTNSNNRFSCSREFSIYHALVSFFPFYVILRRATSVEPHIESIVCMENKSFFNTKKITTRRRRRCCNFLLFHSSSFSSKNEWKIKLLQGANVKVSSCVEKGNKSCLQLAMGYKKNFFVSQYFLGFVEYFGDSWSFWKIL